MEKVLHRSACSECQRRKQKCNREWPCNQCQKRRVSQECRFRDDVVVDPEISWKPSQGVKQKRERRAEEDAEDEDDAAVEGFRAMGYTSKHLLFASLQGDDVQKLNGKPATRQTKVKVANSPALRRALDVLPSRVFIDALVQNFVQTVNYYYYILYPADFLSEYNRWWDDHDKARPLSLEWTFLLMMVVSCSVQHTDHQLGEQLKRELHSHPKELTETYHNAARELHIAIPAERPHIYTVQALLHSCYWYKAEARFEECWNVLGSAVREAQRLGLHQASSYEKLSDFDQEIWRRLWCLVDAWDWLVSTLLARPLHIDRTDVTAELPTLNLEKYPTSPLMHMKLQSELIRIVFAKFGSPKALDNPVKALAYKDVLQTWMNGFPPAYAFVKTDTAQEKTYPWIALHRHYVHTVALSMTLGPLRPYMSKQLTKNSPAAEFEAREQGVTYALRLMGAVHEFFEYVWVRDTTFHFVPFCIFDTAALLTSVVLHDEEESISRRSEIVNAVDLALFTLRRLSLATSTAKTPLAILRKLAVRIPNAERDVPNLNPVADSKKRIKREDVLHADATEKSAAAFDYRCHECDCGTTAGPSTSVSSPYTIDSATGIVTVGAAHASGGEPVTTSASTVSLNAPMPVTAPSAQSTSHHQQTPTSSLLASTNYPDRGYDASTSDVYQGLPNGYALYVQPASQPPPSLRYSYPSQPPMGYAKSVHVEQQYQTNGHRQQLSEIETQPLTQAPHQQPIESDVLVQGMQYTNGPIEFRPDDLGDLGAMWNYEMLDLNLEANQQIM